MNEDLIITQIGLIFSQVRYLRMAIDQVERSTARYAGVALDVAAAGPGQWGAPPLEAGALRVFVVNIGDLIAPDNSFFGVLKSAFRMVVSAASGAIGGFISGIALPVILAELAAITANIVEILKLVGFTGKKEEKQEPGKPEQSGTFTALLDRLTDTAKTLAWILGLANKEQESGKPNTGPDSAEWLQTMLAVERIVQGLNLLLPNLVGAFAALLVRIDSLKSVILGLLDFLVRNVLILRGIVLLTVYDTIASVAHLAAKILAILASGAKDILEAFNHLMKAAISGILEAVKFLSGALSTMVNALLPWLVDTVFGILNQLGQLPIFRLMFAIVEMLPALAPILLRLVNPLGGVSSHEQTILDDARERMIKDLASATTKPPKLADMPDFANLPGVKEAFQKASGQVDSVTDALRKDVPKILGTAGTMLDDVSKQMRDAIGPDGKNLNAGIEKGTGAIVDNAKTLADKLKEAQKAAEPDTTGLKDIADAYEAWLKGGGLENILGRITTYIGNPQTGQNSLLGKIIEGARTLEDLFGGPREPARPTVEIKEVVVEITAAPLAPAEKHPSHDWGELNDMLLDPDTKLPHNELFARGLVFA